MNLIQYIPCSLGALSQLHAIGMNQYAHLSFVQPLKHRNIMDFVLINALQRSPSNLENKQLDAVY